MPDVKRIYIRTISIRVVGRVHPALYYTFRMGKNNNVFLLSAEFLFMPAFRLQGWSTYINLRNGRKAKFKTTFFIYSRNSLSKKILRIFPGAKSSCFLFATISARKQLFILAKVIHMRAYCTDTRVELQLMQPHRKLVPLYHWHVAEFYSTPDKHNYRAFYNMGFNYLMKFRRLDRFRLKYGRN